MKGNSEIAGKSGLSIAEVMASFDWKEVMKYAQFKFDNIERVILAIDGEGDGPDWLLLVELKGGGFGAVRAGCDYTGWGCQEGGDSGKFETEAQARLWLRNRNRWQGDSADERVPL